MAIGFKEFILCMAFLFSIFKFLTAQKVHLDPVTSSYSNVCSSQLANISNARRDVEEALENVVTPYLNSKYGDVRQQCGGPGWTRIVYFNMTDTNIQCPSNWRLNNVVRGCGRSGLAQFTCDSANFNNSGLSYNRVCGRVVAYQKGEPNAFEGYNTNSATSIESAYAAGVLLTHGPVGSRRHIWTFTDALFKESSLYQTSHSVHVCPCTSPSVSWPHNIPPFVGNNYFCDSANPGPHWDGSTLYTDDPLWDGAGCPSTSSCCQFNNPPWFYTSLPETTTDDMEVRLCSANGDEDVIVSLIELYVA